MPIKRRDDSADPLDPYIFLLWNNKWLIAAIAVAAAILVYIILLFVPSTYRVNAEIYVSRLPAMTDGETPNPDTVASLLKSHSVIEKVRDEYVTAFDLKDKPKLEDFVKKFDVESYVLQDTTVRKELSPVLTLQVEAGGTSDTRFIMERWITDFIGEFGNYTSKESVMKLEAYRAEKQRLETEVADVERQKAEAEVKLPYLKKMLAEKLELLSPSKLNSADNSDQKSNVELDLTMQSPRRYPGLLERYSEMEMQIRAGNASSTAPAEMAAIKASIDDARTSVVEAQKELAHAKAQQMETTRHLEFLTQNQSSVNAAISRFTVGAAIYKEMSDTGMPAAGDIRAISMPVTPENRIWPKRTFSALVAAIVAAILTIAVLIARKFLRRLQPGEM